jgi:hypothetical protein
VKNSSYQFVIDRNIQCVFVKHYGLLDLDILLDGNKAVLSHADYDRNLNRVVDISDCDLGLTSEDLRFMVKLFQKQETQRGAYLEAFLVRDMLSHGMARIFSSMIQKQGIECQIFNVNDSNALAAMKQWLQIDPVYIFPDFLVFH